MKKINNEIDFEKLFKGKKIPILTLDERWYNLFREYDKPAHVTTIEEELNILMQRQGKLTNDMKDLKKIKKNLMDEIITHMDVNETEMGMQKAKKLDQNQKLIRDISDRMKNTEDELFDIPYKIKAVNEQLIIESAKECYKRIDNNNQKIDEITLWVAKIREELKNKILLKQDMEMSNAAIYSYMHDIMGADLTQSLDENFEN